jgi:hypothetical protein
VPAATRKGAPVPSPEAAATQKGWIKRRDDIMAEPNPGMCSDEVWNEILEERVAAAFEGFKFAKAGQPAAQTAAGEGERYDPCKEMLVALQAEVKAHICFLKQELGHWSTNKAYAPYGRPLTAGPPERYRFWPSKMKDMPLLYFCAQTLLASTSAATTENERLHSPATAISSKNRSRLAPMSVEMLTLGCVYSRAYIKEYIASRPVKDLEEAWELEQLIEEQKKAREEEKTHDPAVRADEGSELEEDSELDS